MNNPSNKKSGPPDPRSQFKPQVAQSKFRSPAAPNAYRPQPVPKVLQLKRHEVKQSRGVAGAQNVLPKTNGVKQPNAPQHQPDTTNRVAQTPGPGKPSCVQAKMSSGLQNRWSMRKPLSTNIGGTGIRRGNTIQRSASAVAKDDVKHSAKLNEMAIKLHGIAGGTSQNTTGVGKLKNGTLIAYTQLSVDKIKEAAAAMGIDQVANTKGAGYHVEVSMYIDYGEDLQAVGASQGFCPHCQQFLNAKGISMIGVPRSTNDQVWYSPEFYSRKEKSPIGAAYPWAYMKDEVQGKRVTYETRADYVKMYKAITGENPSWMKE